MHIRPLWQVTWPPCGGLLDGYPKLAGWFISWKIPSMEMDDDWGYAHDLGKPPYQVKRFTWFTQLTATLFWGESGVEAPYWEVAHARAVQLPARHALRSCILHISLSSCRILWFSLKSTHIIHHSPPFSLNSSISLKTPLKHELFKLCPNIVSTISLKM